MDMPELTGLDVFLFALTCTAIVSFIWWVVTK